MTAGANVQASSKHRRRSRPAVLLFNPDAGQPTESAAQLVETIDHLQAQGLRLEVHLLRVGSRPEAIVHDALRRGTRLVVVSGGDGTIESTLAPMVGARATLAIIPTGTRNNVARCLGIPVGDVAAAAAVAGSGRPARIDVGLARTRGGQRWFLEFAAVGLAPALYPAADELQHGNWAGFGELLTTLVGHNPSRIRLRIDSRRPAARGEAHLVMAANMPLAGPNLQLAPDVSFMDGTLDVLMYARQSKLDIIGAAVQMAAGTPEDPRVWRYSAREFSLDADPPMPVMADGFLLGESPLRAVIRPRALTVMAGLMEAV